MAASAPEDRLPPPPTSGVSRAGTAAADGSAVSSASGAGRPSLSQAAPNPGETIADKYQIDSLLGQGGMGTVYIARHSLSGRKVALKWLDAEYAANTGLLQRFMHEVQAMGRIDHPNVVGVLDAGIHAGSAYLTMELLRGESLRDLIDRDAPVSPQAAIALLMPAMEGVEAAHRAHVVHRDLKPENLFVVRRSSGAMVTTKVLDFGISKLGERGDGPVAALTQTGHVVGTPHYMAPEQVRAGTIDARTDVWALGVILYELMSGRTPFAAESFGALLIAIAVEAHIPLTAALPGLDPRLADVIHRALAKDPAERWPSVRAFALALTPFAPGVIFHDPPPRGSERPPPIASQEFTPTPAPAQVATSDAAPSSESAPLELDWPVPKGGPAQRTGPEPETRALPRPAPVASPSVPRAHSLWMIGAVVVLALAVAAAGWFAFAETPSPPPIVEEARPLRPTTPAPIAEVAPSPPSAPPAPPEADPGVVEELPEREAAPATPARREVESRPRHRARPSAASERATGAGDSSGRTGSITRGEF